MKQALELAKQAANAGEVPVGAVIVFNDEVVAFERNRMREFGDPMAHAEILVIKNALEILQKQRLEDCDIYVSLEPCTMCAGAISLAKIRRVYYGAEDEKGGAIDNGVRFFNAKTCHHRPEVVGGMNEAEAALLLKKFFAERR
jgi:tRNA(adenine34) deaminase